MFRIEAASVGYNGRAVLNAVSLVVNEGERVALVGRSGAGKSTLLRLLYQQQKSRVAIVPQDFGLVRSLSVFHNIFMGRLARNATWYNLANLARPFGREIDAVRALALRLGLDEKLFAPAGELSGGQQQRTAVGRALYFGGDALLGDEPVSAVDEHQARAVLESINSAHRTVILAMHDVALALAHTERVVGLKDGRIVLDAPAARLSPADLASLYTS